MQYRYERQLLQWQTQAICTFIAAQAGLWMDTSKSGGKNPLADAAAALSIDGKPRDWQPGPEDVSPDITGPPVEEPDAANPPMGSYERFMHAFSPRPDGGGIPPMDTS